MNTQSSRPVDLTTAQTAVLNTTSNRDLSLAIKADLKSNRSIQYRTRGHGHGFITRLMSPSDLGEVLKPFVFLDLFDANANVVKMMQAGQGMGLHPHSGIATVTVITSGSLAFDDQHAGRGEISYGGVEWMRASRGVWHGQEMTPNNPAGVQGFQLWLALPAALELAESESRYIEAKDMQRVGPAHVIVGKYADAQSPVPAPEGVNYLLVTLKAGEQWTYTPPQGHQVGWLAVAKGRIELGESVGAGDMVVFEAGEQAISMVASEHEAAVLVLGSAVPHPHPLHLGHYSVHTNAQALIAGERHIKALKKQIDQVGDRRNDSGVVPVFR